MARSRVMRRSSGFRRSPGRLTEWFGAPFTTQPVPLANSTFLLDSSLGATGLAKRPFTITRTIGLLSILSDQNAAVEVPFGAMGFQVVSEKAVATGVTAVPDPVTEVDDDAWFVYQAWCAEGTASTNAGRPIQQFPFDSRAQRKVEDGQNLAVVVANANNNSGAQYVLNYRILVKLS